MSDTEQYDLVILGGGTAGLVAAAGAAALGARTALVERDRLGGECLWTGCVPSKALIGSARVADSVARAEEYGLRATESPAPPGGESPFRGSVLESVREARSRIQPHDDPERFRDMGVDVLEGAAGRLVSPGEVRAGDRRLRTRKAMIATGSRPAVPPVDGLEEAGYFTHEEAFDRRELPASVVVLGAGAIGVELAQAYARLDVEVTLVEMEPRVLPREDEEMSRRVRQLLEEEGVRVLTGAVATEARRRGGERELGLQTAQGAGGGRDGGTAGTSGREGAGESGPEEKGPGEDVPRQGGAVSAEEILVAAGRRPNVEGLGLAAAGVETGPEGVRVDDRLRTTAPGVFAAGDVIGGHQFTHVADHEARTVVRNALFPFSSPVDYSVIPWAIFCEPELARVGLTESEAREEHGDGVGVYRYDLSELDRAVTDRRARGLVKLVADEKGRLLGAHVLAASAGTMIVEAALAMREGTTIAELSDLVHPYPTMSEGIRRAANEYRRSQLTPSVEKWLGRYFRLARKLGL